MIIISIDITFMLFIVKYFSKSHRTHLIREFLLYVKCCRRLEDPSEDVRAKAVISLVGFHFDALF